MTFFCLEKIKLILSEIWWLFFLFSEDSANEDFLGAPASPMPRPVTPLHFDTEVNTVDIIKFLWRHQCMFWYQPDVYLMCSNLSKVMPKYVFSCHDYWIDEWSIIFQYNLQTFSNFLSNFFFRVVEFSRTFPCSVWSSPWNRRRGLARRSWRSH